MLTLAWRRGRAEGACAAADPGRPQMAVARNKRKAERRRADRQMTSSSEASQAETQNQIST